MMRKKIYRTVLALSLLGADPSGLHAQLSPFDEGMAAQAALIRDELVGFTDRSLYISGEAIRFSMRLQTSGLSHERAWSTVLYVDLISASGLRQAQGKFLIHRGMASGELRIPEGLLSGVYVLRAYTRWMRNRGPSSYTYQAIRIINPFSPELDAAQPGEQGEHLLSSPALHGGGLEISTGSYSHGRGDTILVELSQSSGDGPHALRGCLSIVPAVAKPGTPMQAENNEGHEEVFQVDYLPDLHGVSLSGRIRGSGEEQALEGRRIHFTIMGEQPGYAFARADAHGRFILTLPRREGRLELLVQPEQALSGDMEIRIDQDFDSRVLSLDLPSFSLDQVERDGLVLMARKHQLASIYRDTSAVGKPQGQFPKVPIYGTPDFRLNLDDYVLLPTLEEVFINLVQDVTPLVRRNRTDLSIASVNPAISMFPPLLMIDQVPLFSMEQFLSVSPRKISHIDLISDVFVRGDLRYGGIINLWSLEGNMAGIDLPGNSFFIDYFGLTPEPGPALPSGPGREADPTNEHHPDTRNTLLWMPDLQLEGPVQRSISFVAPDYPGDYVVIYRGWDEQGRLVSAESRFVVE